MLENILENGLQNFILVIVVVHQRNQESRAILPQVVKRDFLAFLVQRVDPVQVRLPWPDDQHGSVDGPHGGRLYRQITRCDSFV